MFPTESVEHNEAGCAWKEGGRKRWGPRKADNKRDLLVIIATVCQTMIKRKRQHHPTQSQSLKVTEARPASVEATSMAPRLYSALSAN